MISMKQFYISLFAILFCHLISFGQSEVENWESYIAAYEENKPGSTTVRMDIIDKTPFKEYQYVLITGIKYESNREDGFPENETFKLLHAVGDELIELINENSENIFVGSFMFDFQRQEYFYIQSDNGIETKLQEFYNSKYPNNEHFIFIEEDKNWSYYREFLYPSDEIKEYLGDQGVVQALIYAGDDLSKARRVDHWTYFDSKSKMRMFQAEVKKLGFIIQNATKIKSATKPYVVQFYREDKVDIDSIYAITSNLRKLAISYEGEYDGWETFVIEE